MEHQQQLEFQHQQQQELFQKMLASQQHLIQPSASSMYKGGASLSKVHGPPSRSNAFDPNLHSQRGAILDYAGNPMPLRAAPKISQDRQLQLESRDGWIYKVHFKRASRNFILGPRFPPQESVVVGSFVKVEADRGEDLGICVEKVRVQDFVEKVPTAGYRGRGFCAGPSERKFIARLATKHELQLMQEKVEDEYR